MLSPANSARTPCSLATTASPCTGRAQRSHDHMKGPQNALPWCSSPAEGAASPQRRRGAASAPLQPCAAQHARRLGGGPGRGARLQRRADGRPRRAGAARRAQRLHLRAATRRSLRGRARQPAPAGSNGRPGALQGPGRPHPSASHQPLVGETKGAVLGPRHHAMRPVKHICDLRRCGPQS